MTRELTPTDQTPTRRVSARHTLGSDPDGAGAPAPTGDELSPEREASPAELKRPVWWLAAQQRAATWEGSADARKLVARLVDQVDQMWSAVDELEALYSAEPERPAHERDSSANFLNFLKREVVGRFLTLSRLTARMLSRSTETCRDLARFEDEEAQFACNLDVVRLAASDPIIPEFVRVVVQRSALRLSDTLPDFSALVGALAAASESEPCSRHS